MNPLYQMLMGNQSAPPAPMVSPAPQAVPFSNMNPLQRVGFIRRAMANPAAFIKQQFPDIPDNISNNPDQILNYLQRTRGITDQQIQNLYGMYGGQ